MRSALHTYIHINTNIICRNWIICGAMRSATKPSQRTGCIHIVVYVSMPICMSIFMYVCVYALKHATKPCQRTDCIHIVVYVSMPICMCIYVYARRHVTEQGISLYVCVCMCKCVYATRTGSTDWLHEYSSLSMYVCIYVRNYTYNHNLHTYMPWVFTHIIYGYAYSDGWNHIFEHNKYTDMHAIIFTGTICTQTSATSCLRAQCIHIIGSVLVMEAHIIHKSMICTHTCYSYSYFIGKCTGIHSDMYAYIPFLFTFHLFGIYEHILVIY